MASKPCVGHQPARSAPDGDHDLLPHLEARFRAELADALAQLPPVAVLRRVPGTRWAPA